MENINLSKILSNQNSTLYFIGIGGIAMSAVASLSKELGFSVSGSDSKEIYSPAKDVVDFSEIDYFKGYSESNVNGKKIDLFILSAGEDLNNPEVNFVVKNNLPRVGLAEFLGEISKDKLRVVVSGTHGKTTTTGLLGSVIRHIDDSSFITGGVLQNTGSNFNYGNGHYFVFEGDEYKEQFDDPTPKFHYYKPDILVITNLEYDHPDLFTNFEEMEKEYEHLISNLPSDGLLVYNADDINLSRLARNTEVASVSFGIENEADYKAETLKYDKDYTTIDVFNKFSKQISTHLLGQTEQYKIQLPGRLNVYNALAVIATLRALGFPQEEIQLELLAYRGIKRRFEIIGTKNGITLIDDYAHHPTAVRETLHAARLKFFSVKDQGLRIKDGSKLWAIFEPHTFSRTKATQKELSEAFDMADEVLISEIYPAREKVSNATITSKEVIDAIKLHNSKHNIQNSVRKVMNKQDALDILKKELKPGDVVIVMAVGDFNRLAYELRDIL